LTKQNTDIIHPIYLQATNINHGLNPLKNS